MIRTVLVDDEPDSIRILQRILQSYCPGVEIVGKGDGVESAERVIRDLAPDLVILDIEMIQGNAFDLLNRLQPLSFQVIFVTAFDNYAIRAFKYSAVDYLLKPVDVDDLCGAIERVVCRSRDEVDSPQVKMLLQNVANLSLSQQKMAIPTLTGLDFVPISAITRLEAQGSYTGIHLDSGECILATKNIKEYEDILSTCKKYKNTRRGGGDIS